MTPSRAERAWALAAGAALAACAVGLARGWFGAFEVGVGPFVLATLGIGVGALVGRRAGAGLFLLGGAGLALGPGGAWLSTHTLGAALLATCAAGAGAVWAGLSLGPAAAAGYGALGAALVALVAGSQPLAPVLWIGLGTGLGAFACAVGGDAAGRTPRFGARPDAGLAGLISLRLGCTAVVSASAAGLLLDAGSPLGLAGGALHVAPSVCVGLGVALLAGSALTPLAGRATALVTEPLGWLVVLALGYRIPEWLGDSGFGLRLAASVGGALAGVALIGPLRRGAGWGCLALVLAWPLGDAILDVSADRWARADRAALALGVGGPAAETLRSAVEKETVRVRFSDTGAASVAVVDVASGQRELRLLSVNGAVRGSIPTHADAPRDVMTSNVLVASLPTLFAEAAPARVAVLGLETGVTAGAVLRAASVEALGVVEPLDGVVRAHRDPGELFGFANHRPLEDSRTQLIRAPFLTFLRRATPARWDALVAGRSLDPRDPRVGRVAERAGCYAWRVDALRSDRLAAQPAYVFDGGDETFVVWGGQGVSVSLERAEERLKANPQLAQELARVGFGSAYELVAALVWAPGGTVPERSGPLSRDVLRSAGAGSLTRAIGFGAGEQASTRMARLAECLAIRQSPAALPLAEAAVSHTRSARTLRTLGDLLLQRGAETGAVEAWRASLALDASDVSTRLSLANYYTQRQAWSEGLEALRPALGVDAARDAQVHYYLGQLELGAKSYAAARRHFRKAGRFKNAPSLKALAEQLGGPAPPKTVPPEIKLRAAGRLVERALAARAEADRRRLWDDATTALLDLADTPDALDRGGQLKLARLLDRCAEQRDPVGRAALLRLEAEILEPHATDRGRLAVKRAQVLGRAGETKQAEALLVELAESGSDPAVAARALGDLLKDQGRLEGAIEAWRRAIRLSPQSSLHSRIYLAIASAYTELGDHGAAAGTLKTAERLQPGSLPVRLALGDALLAAGQRGAAREAYRRFLEIAPPRHADVPRVKRALATLDR